MSESTDNFMMAESTAQPLAPEVNESEISPQEAAVLRHEADALAMQLNDAAKAADALAVDPSIPDEERAAMAIRAQTMRGQASALSSMRAGALRTNLPIIAASAVGMMAIAKAERNDAVVAASQEASYAMGSATMYSADQFTERSYASQQNLRDYLQETGQYTTSTDTYFNSVTEAQFRSYEEDMKARIAKATGDEKTVLENELKSMDQLKWKQLNDEALKGHENWAAKNPDLASKMHDMHERGLLPDKSDVADPKLRESLAIVDANKFMEMEDRIREKQRNGEQLNGEEQRALRWLDGAGKDLTPEQRAQITQAAKELEAETTKVREENKDKFPALQAEVAKIREEGLKAGKSPEQIQKEIEAKQNEYCEKHGFNKTEREMAERIAQGKEQKNERPIEETQKPVEQTKWQELNANLSEAQKAEIMSETSKIRAESANAAAADQKVQIAADSQTVANVPTSPKAEMLAQLGFKPDDITRIMGIVSVAQHTGIEGGQEHYRGDPPRYQLTNNSNHAMEALIAAESAHAKA